ncbi:MAG: protein-glutamate O-methyltransferase CheR [Blastocatellia bacterium]|nr:protein-glutamate O-methyltransferase CheR [Blastocatellia bacterium]
MRTLETALSSVYGWAANPALKQVLQNVVSNKSQRLGLDEFTYCRMAAKSRGELHSVAEEIALGETSFFREPEQYRALRAMVLPELLERHNQDHKLKIWSAGCSSGEEPFSLAILLEELIPANETWRVEILAVDLRSRALLEASQGRYHPAQLQHLASPVREKFFLGHHGLDGTQVELDRRVRRNVKFRHANLYDPQLWQHLPGLFDLIVCSNVLMHMHHTAMQQTLNRIVQALVPGGYLMVGVAETGLFSHSKLKAARSLPSGFFVKPE